MDSKQLLEAADVLDWVSVRLRELPEAREDALTASLHCTIANLIVVELARHLSDGVDPYDALRRAAVGSLTIRPAKTEVLRLLATMIGQREPPLS